MGLAALPLAITLVVAPAQLRMEPGAAPATVTVSAPGVVRLRLWCSAGQLGRAQALGDGRFTVSWTAPPAGKPTFAVLAAWDENSGEAGTATVTLVGRTEIPVETEAGALVTATVHGRRSTAHANDAGHARVPAWVWPGDRVATVTATDAAGNTTTGEVALDLAPPDGVFLLAPSAVVAQEPVRVWAFATSAATPDLAASGGTLSFVERQPGAAAATLRAPGEVTLTATAGADRATRRIRIAAVTPPPENSLELAYGPQEELPKWAQQHGDAPVTPPGSTPPPAAQRPLSRYELGLALVGRTSGAFLGIGPTLEARRTLGRWFAVGADLDGRYAVGKVGAQDLRGGGLGLRLTGEFRLRVAARLTLFASAGVGGHWAHVRRTNPAGNVTTTNDGGPSLSIVAGLLVRVGPGYLTSGLGFAWTPLVHNSLADLDGGLLSVGYRLARWPRRPRRRGAGGTRPPRRRRRARGR